MKRPIPILAAAAALFAAVPAFAQNSAPAGRYQIAPDENGFIRLDTETGALSHCRKDAGAWRCDVLVEEQSNLDRRIDALDGRVAALTGEIGRLTGRLDALEEGLRADRERPAPAPAPSAEEREQELDQALTFAERLMRRFFDMVRELKGEEEAQRI